MKRSTMLLLLIACGFLAASTGYARGRDLSKGWFLGGTAGAQQLDGYGTLNTTAGELQFDVKRKNMLGLAHSFNAVGDLGLGWENDMLMQTKVTLGYRFSPRVLARFHLAYLAPQKGEVLGIAPDAPNVAYLREGRSLWKQHSFQAIVDWVPFEPLPVWFLSFGLEIASFSTRMEHVIEVNDGAGNVSRDFYSYTSAGGSWGVLIGSGINLPQSLEMPGVETYIAFSYSWLPYNQPFYLWDGKLLVGGATLEAGFRYYLPRKEG